MRQTAKRASRTLCGASNCTARLPDLMREICVATFKGLSRRYLGFIPCDSLHSCDVGRTSRAYVQHSQQHTIRRSEVSLRVGFFLPKNLCPTKCYVTRQRTILVRLALPIYQKPFATAVILSQTLVGAHRQFVRKKKGQASRTPRGSLSISSAPPDSAYRNCCNLWA